MKENLIDENYNIIEGDKVNFYISFNNILLDEVELNRLIKEHEEDINILEKKISEKEEAKEFYIDKKSFIKESSLTKLLYTQLEDKIQKLKKRFKLIKKI